MDLLRTSCGPGVDRTACRPGPLLASSVAGALGALHRVGRGDSGSVTEDLDAVAVELEESPNLVVREFLGVGADPRLRHVELFGKPFGAMERQGGSSGFLCIALVDVHVGSVARWRFDPKAPMTAQCPIGRFRIRLDPTRCKLPQNRHMLTP